MVSLQLHNGVNLAVAFAQVLEDFGIAHKVSGGIHNSNVGQDLPGVRRSCP